MSKHVTPQTASITSAALALIIAVVHAPTDYVPRPSFPKPVLEGLASLKQSFGPDKSVVASWWDYGYASLFLNDLPTLHDGGNQTGPTTHLVAQALLTSDQAETVGILQFLAREGNLGIQRYDAKTALSGAFKVPGVGPVSNIYLVLTNQMAGWIGSISKLGNWDIETGQPVILPDNNGASHVDYIRLGCNYRRFPSSVVCGNVTFDFDKGLMNDAPAITGWTRARDGFSQDVRQYSEMAPFGVQTLQTNNRLTSQLMHRQLYHSSFNKLYHLGLIETPGITLVYDNYPHIRIYKIAGTD